MQRSCVIVEIMSLRHLKTEVFRLRMDLKKKESDMSDKALPNWVKVDKKRFNRIKTKSKMLKIIIYMVSQIAVVLLVLTSHTD